MASVLYQRVIGQLDGLVIFMGLCEEPFFEQLTNRWNNLIGLPEHAKPPASYEVYEQLVLRSSLLLGVAYAEAYLADALRAVLRLKPLILASRQKNVSWENVVKAADLQSLIDTLIDKEILEFTHLAIDGMLEYVRDKLSLTLASEDDLRTVKAAAIVRNLITHNSVIANNELARLDPQFECGQCIRLSSGLVHRYGFAGRALIRGLDEQLVESFGIEGSA